MLAFLSLSKGELNKRVGNVLGSIHGERITGSRHGETLERGRRCKGIANNPFLNEDSPLLGIRRRAPSPTRSNQNFKLLYIRLSMNLSTKELINIELEKALKKATNPFLHYTERSDAATLVMMLTKALRETEWT